MRIDSRTSYTITQPGGYTGFGIGLKSLPSKTGGKSIRDIASQLKQVAGEYNWDLKAMVDPSHRTPFVRFELSPSLTSREAAPITKAYFLRTASSILTGGEWFPPLSFQEHVVAPAVA